MWDKTKKEFFTRAKALGSSYKTWAILGKNPTKDKMFVIKECLPEIQYYKAFCGCCQYKSAFDSCASCPAQWPTVNKCGDYFMPWKLASNLRIRKTSAYAQAFYCRESLINISPKAYLKAKKELEPHYTTHYIP